jgi:hypothetical protein
LLLPSDRRLERRDRPAVDEHGDHAAQSARTPPTASATVEHMSPIPHDNHVAVQRVWIPNPIASLIKGGGEMPLDRRDQAAISVRTNEP